MYCDKDAQGRYSICDLTETEMRIVHAAMSFYRYSREKVSGDLMPDPLSAKAIASIADKADCIGKAIYKIMESK